MIQQLFGVRLAMMLTSLQNLELPSLKREEGQTLAEYALILALIAVVVVGVVVDPRRHDQGHLHATSTRRSSLDEEQGKHAKGGCLV